MTFVLVPWISDMSTRVACNSCLRNSSSVASERRNRAQRSRTIAGIIFLGCGGGGLSAAGFGVPCADAALGTNTRLAATRAMAISVVGKGLRYLGGGVRRHAPCAGIDMGKLLANVEYDNRRSVSQRVRGGRRSSDVSSPPRVYSGREPAATVFFIFSAPAGIFRFRSQQVAR